MPGKWIRCSYRGTKARRKNWGWSLSVNTHKDLRLLVSFRSSFFVRLSVNSFLRNRNISQAIPQASSSANHQRFSPTPSNPDSFFLSLLSLFRCASVPPRETSFSLSLCDPLWPLCLPPAHCKKTLRSLVVLLRRWNDPRRLPAVVLKRRSRVLIEQLHAAEMRP